MNLDEIPDLSFERDHQIVALNDALNALSIIDARKARVIELRCFGGLSVEETAAALGISLSTLNRELRTAKAWLTKTIRAALHDT